MSNGRLVKVTIGGPKMLMHNGQLADPLNEWTRLLKEASKKAKKSDDDHWETARIEFQGSLYIDDEIGPHIPGENISQAILQGARKKKRGKEFGGISVVEELVPLEFDGPRTRDALWSDPRFRDRRGAVVGRARIMRTRPKFRDWKLSFTVEIPPGVPVNPADIEEALIDAGMFVGVGDWRPGSPKGGRWGLFTVITFEELKPGAKRAA